jgi:hypothetical protein
LIAALTYGVNAACQAAFWRYFRGGKIVIREGASETRIVLDGQRAYFRELALLEAAMPAIVSTVSLSRPLLFVAAGGGVLLAAALGLWAYYGTAVFFEMVRAGWLACF